MRFALAAFLLTARALSAQPAFEVASIKPSLSPREAIAAGKNTGARIEGSRVDIGLASLTALIKTAYQVETWQISGPDWMATERFDIAAKMPEGATKEQFPAMLRTLLADRFHLVVRRETREQTVYALVVDKDGPKLTVAPPDAGTSGHPFPNGRDGRIPVIMESTISDGYRTYSRYQGSLLYEAEKITTPELALMLMSYVDEPVIDSTGLTGAYQVAMKVPGMPQRPGRPAAKDGIGRGGAPAAADSATPTAEAAEPSGVSIFKELQKLGLRLEKRKAPVEHLVVEHLEKAPTEN
jgi:uncharacterized protein (TIGR03435 family)